MGIIKRKIAWDNDGAIPLATLLLIWFPGALTLGAFAYETAVEPLIEPETAPTLAGMGIEYLWVICALIFAITFFIWIALGSAKTRKS